MLNANFKAKWVIKLLQENYKTYCALKGKKDELKGNFKDAVMSVLKESGLGALRTSQKREAEVNTKQVGASSCEGVSRRYGVFCRKGMIVFDLLGARPGSPPCVRSSRQIGSEGTFSDI